MPNSCKGHSLPFNTFFTVKCSELNMTHTASSVYHFWCVHVRVCVCVANVCTTERADLWVDAYKHTRTRMQLSVSLPLMVQIEAGCYGRQNNSRSWAKFSATFNQTGRAVGLHGWSQGQGKSPASTSMYVTVHKHTLKLVEKEKVEGSRSRCSWSHKDCLYLACHTGPREEWVFWGVMDPQTGLRRSVGNVWCDWVDGKHSMLQWTTSPQTKTCKRCLNYCSWPHYTRPVYVICTDGAGAYRLSRSLGCCLYPQWVAKVLIVL